MCGPAARRSSMSCANFLPDPHSGSRSLRTDGAYALKSTSSQVISASALTCSECLRTYVGATLMRPGVFEKVYSSLDRVFVHASTFMGNALACAAANSSLDLFETEPRVQQVADIAAGLTSSSPAQLRTFNGALYFTAFESSTGRELWRLKSEGDIPVPTPFMAHGLIYVANAHGGKAPLYAIRPEASGDITPAPGSRSSAGVAWSDERNGHIYRRRWCTET